MLGTLAAPTLSIRLGSADAGNNPETSTTRRAYDLLSDGFGAGFNGPILAVFDIENEAGVAAMEALPEKLEALEGIAFSTPPFMNPAGDAGLMTIIPTTAPQDEETSETLDRLRAFLATELEGSGATAPSRSRATTRSRRRCRQCGRRGAASGEQLLRRRHARARPLQRAALAVRECCLGRLPPLDTGGDSGTDTSRLTEH